MLKETFTELLKNYSENESLALKLWKEIEKNYSSERRHYHTLQHLSNLLAQLTEIKHELKDPDTVLFTLFYHDIIYDPVRSDNEEKSAGLAEKHLKLIGVSPAKIASCQAQILATKTHPASPDSDTNYFTDADLSVLGQAWETYNAYFKNIRKEYAVYPDSVYNTGRKKVLNHFLAMNSIFKTEFFKDKFEVKAKQNLQNELDLLNN